MYRLIPVSNVQLTASYIRHISALETMYGAVIGTNYLVVFILLVIVYSKCLAYIKKMREEVGKHFLIALHCSSHSIIQILSCHFHHSKQSYIVCLFSSPPVRGGTCASQKECSCLYYCVYHQWTLQ